MIVDFARLSDAAAILRFAQRWGPMGICKHRELLPHQGPWGECWFQMREKGAWLEPVPVWQKLTREAAAMLRISRRLHVGDLGDRADWKLLDLGEEEIGVAETRAGLAKNILLKYQWNGLLAAVNNWLWPGEIRPLLVLRRERPVFCLDSWWLYGALGLQLALAVCGSRSFGVCEACGKFFQTQRRRKYCSECGLNAAWRRASKKRYDKRRDVLRRVHAG